MSLKYKGWVPCVLGNLSFKILGHSAYPFPFTSKIEEAESGNINIFCVQKRIPADYQLPIPIPYLPKKTYLKICSFLARKLAKENIESIFILKATGEKEPKTGTVQEIKGTIYIVIKNIDKLNEQEEIFNKLLNWDPNSNQEELYSLLKENCIFKCDVILNRQGICDFTASRADDAKMTDSVC